jgi:F-type H+-transporting ATPase subunit delta
LNFDLRPNERIFQNLNIKNSLKIQNWKLKIINMKITATQYAKSLYELTDGKTKQDINGVVVGFVKVLQKNNQIRLVKNIIEKFSNLYNQKNGIVEAEITSREALGKDVSNKLRNYVSTKYKAKEVVIKNKIDEQIKGGIIIKVGDEIVDASISGKLRSLRSSLEK